MKKFLAMILACVSVAAFAGCGATGDSAGNNGGSGGESTGGGNGGVTVDTEVTADEFAAAFDFGTNYTCLATQTYEGQGVEYWSWYRADNLFKSVIELKDMDGNPIEGEHVTENFAEKVGDVVYEYTPMFIDGVLQHYYKEVSEATFEEIENEDIGAMIPEEMKVFASYTYNADTQAYEIAELTVSYYVVQNVYLKFVDNKLVAGGYTAVVNFGETTMSIPMAFTVTYGGVTITLPTNVVVE